MLMKYEWDSKKNQSNVEERGIDFELAHDLDWDTVIEAQDMRVESEVRMRAYGLIDNRLCCFIYTMRGDICRVISLRKANKREVREYGKA